MRSSSALPLPTLGQFGVLSFIPILGTLVLELGKEEQGEQSG